MAITIKKIAEVAGVSTGTVDRALNNRGRIKSSVAERIRQIAKELNYQPNSVAKSLSIRNKGFKIAVILHVNDNLYIRELVRGINKASDEIADAGFSVVIKPCRDFDGEEQLRLINESLEENAKAIIIIPISHHLVAEKINELSEQKFPVIFLNSSIQNTDFLMYFGVNFIQTGIIGARLISLATGEKANLAVFPPQFQMYGHIERINSMKTYLKDNYPDITICSITEIPNDENKACQTVKKVLDDHPEIDAILYYTGAVESGLKTILGSENCKKMRIITVDTTTVVLKALEEGSIIATLNQKPLELGFTAVKALFDYITANKLPQNKYNYVNVEVLFKEHLSTAFFI